MTVAPGKHYDYEVHPGDGSSSGWLAQLTGSGVRVLDLGCAAGALARVLIEKGCSVVGLDIDRDAAKLAEQVCERVVVADLDTDDLSLLFEGDSFDVITAGDVFEHLRDPRRTLIALRALLRPGGSLALTIPNVAHGSVRLALLHGSFPKADLGLLDRTHMQFLTRDDVIEMLTDTGWLPVVVDGTRLGISDSEVPYPDDAMTGSVMDAVMADPLSVVYQHVVLAYPATTAEELPPTARMLLAARTQLAETFTHVRNQDNTIEILDAEVVSLREKNAAAAAVLKEELFMRQLTAVDLEAHHKLAIQSEHGHFHRMRQVLLDDILELRERVEELQSDIEDLTDKVEERDAELSEIKGSKLWKRASSYRRLRARANI